MFELYPSFCKYDRMHRFVKYHGLGNDFIVMARREGDTPLSASEVIRLCDRHLGIGADGILSLWPDSTADIRMQVQNSDGSESAMCGNGLRCVARYMWDENLVPLSQKSLWISAGEGRYLCERVLDDLADDLDEATGDDKIRVNLGSYTQSHADLPDQASKGPVSLSASGKEYEATCIHVGNPHAIIFESESPRSDVARSGSTLEHHPSFKNRVNITFARATALGFEAAVHERGVGATLACGSAACALGAAAVRAGRWPKNSPMKVDLPGGSLWVNITSDDSSDDNSEYASKYSEEENITLEGSATRVFEGQVVIS